MPQSKFLVKLQLGWLTYIFFGFLNHDISINWLTITFSLLSITINLVDYERPLSLIWTCRARRQDHLYEKNQVNQININSHMIESQSWKSYWNKNDSIYEATNIRSNWFLSINDLLSKFYQTVKIFDADFGEIKIQIINKYEWLGQTNKKVSHARNL